MKEVAYYIHPRPGLPQDPEGNHYLSKDLYKSQREVFKKG
jgi:hypothetical protein